MEDKNIKPSTNQGQDVSLTTTNTGPILAITGGTKLAGEVKISGAKNSALAIMAGTLLCSGECRLSNLPSLVDITSMSEVLIHLGVQVSRNGDILAINSEHLQKFKANYDLVSQLRASFFVIGPILTRLGIAQIPLPGGCAIGARPVDLHVKGLQLMGADVIIEHGIVNAHVTNKRGKLQGAKIYLDYPSVGATETLLMAATLAEGETVLENAAQEPEVVDLANFCLAMGAKIQGAGTNTITITGVDRLHSVDYPIIADRIEAGTFLVAAAITNSEITLTRVIPEHLTAVIAKLEEMGAQVIRVDEDKLRVIPGELRGVNLETMPYPGFPTDMQAQFMALLSISDGNSLVTETVFENRLRHVSELNRMGANIRLKGNNAIITGVSRLSGAPVMATDLRASAALVVAALAAKGETIIQGLHHLDRGYDNLEGKLNSIGANIRRIP